MTKCGHVRSIFHVRYLYLIGYTQVFCFPCILHYLSTSENKWARCPICFDSVNERQLKSVKWYDGPVYIGESVNDGQTKGLSSSSALDNIFETTPREGSSLCMRLIQRPQITTLALPRSHTWPSDLLPPHQAPFHFLPDVYDFAKFMLATPAYLVSDLTRDLDELASERRVLSMMNDSLGVMFIDGADRKVREQIAKASALETPILKNQIDKARRDQREIEERVAFHARRQKAEEDAHAAVLSSEVPHEFLAARSGGNQTPTPVHSASQPNALRTQPQGRNQPRQRRNLNPPPPSTSTYYYYQAASGLPLFLHPLDIRILLSHFGGYSSFPDNITVRVESVAEGAVNDDLRKRCKYLAHMPEGADVIFVEADLDNVVSVEGLKSFEGPLKMRTARRKEKIKKEDRARFRAEEKEKERLSVPWSASRSSTAQPLFIADLPTEDFSALGDVSDVPPPVESHPVPAGAPIPAASGAWGPRSFATAALAPAGRRPPSTSQRPRQVVEDEFDIDVAWHELEQRNGGGGRRKRANKLVVLGSGGGGARRR